MPQTQRTGHWPRTVRAVATNARDRLLHAQALSQAGGAEFDVIHRNDITQVRAYRPLECDAIDVMGETVEVASTRHRIPLVIVPPLAVNMLIYDLFPSRSLVRYFLARGFDVYLIDWGRPTPRHNHRHLSTYLQDLMPEALAAIRAHAGAQQLSLHGWSMGGIFAYGYAALGDPDIANVMLLGPPCDYHAEGGANWQNRLLGAQVKAAEKWLGWRVHNTRRRWWRAPGWANSLAFKLVSPGGTLRGYAELLRNLHDREFVTGHATHASFLDDMVAYPGGVIQDIVQFLLTDNCLARGRLPIPGCEADLAAIQSDLLMVIGSTDPIVPPPSSLRLLELTPEAEHTVLEVPGGHMSIVSGSNAPKAIWAPAADWLAARSG